MYNKSRRIFEIITAILCFITAVLLALAGIDGLSIDASGVEYVLLVVVGLVLSAISLLFGVLLIRKPKQKNGVWKNNKVTHVLVIIEMLVVIGYSLLAMILYVVLGIAIGLGGAEGGGGLAITCSIFSCVTGALTLIFNIISMCIKTEKKNQQVETAEDGNV